MKKIEELLVVLVLVLFKVDDGEESKKRAV
jgi:hypothetical protein